MPLQLEYVNMPIFVFHGMHFLEVMLQFLVKMGRVTMGHQINFILYFLVSFIVSGISLLKSFVAEVGLGKSW